MKISTLALSLLAVTGTAIVGGSYFTGKQAEQRYQDFIALGNQQLKQLNRYGIHAEINAVKFERHWFSSQITYTLAAKIDHNDYVFKGNDTLYHGPFPLNRVSKGHLLPIAASLESELTAPQNFTDLFNNPSQLLSAKTDIGYTGNLSGWLQMPAFKLDNLESGAIHADYDLAKSGKGTLSADIAKFKTHRINQSGYTFAIHNLKTILNFSENQGYPALKLGTYRLSADRLNLQFAAADKPHDVYFENVDLKGKNRLAGERYQSEGDVSGKMVINHINFGNLALRLKLEADKTLSNKLLLDQQAVEIWKNLAQKGLNLHLTPLKLTNDKGEYHTDLSLNIKPFDHNVKNPLAVLNLLEKSTFSTRLDLAAIEHSITQIALSQGADQAAAEEQGKFVAYDLQQSANQSQFMLADDKQIKMDLSVDRGNITLNGREMSQSEVQNILIMLMFSLGSLGF